MSNKNVVNLSDLAITMKENYGISLKEAKANINMVLNTIQVSLEDEETDAIQLVGFGTFEKRIMAERKGRDFKSGNEVIIPEHTRVVFKLGSNLKKIGK